MTENSVKLRTCQFLCQTVCAILVMVYMMRHTAATMMLSGGVDVKTVQEVLGHENLNTTQIYTHIENTELKIVYYLPLEVGNEAKKAEAFFELLIKASNE